MANFEVKYRAGSEVKSEVLTASDELAAGKAFGSSHHGISAADVISVINIGKYYPKYRAANFVCALMSFAGWAAFLLGVVGLIAGVFTASIVFGETRGFDPMRQTIITVALAGSGFSVLLALIGLLMAAVGEHLRATTDAANHLGEILALMRSSKV